MVSGSKLQDSVVKHNHVSYATACRLRGGENIGCGAVERDRTDTFYQAQCETWVNDLLGHATPVQ